MMCDVIACIRYLVDKVCLCVSCTSIVNITRERELNGDLDLYRRQSLIAARCNNKEKLNEYCSVALKLLNIFM